VECGGSPSSSQAGLLACGARLSAVARHRLAAGGAQPVAWLPRLAAGRGCVPLAAVPMGGECNMRQAQRGLQAWASTGTRRETRLPRPAAGGAQPRDVAAASRGRPWLRASGRSAHGRRMQHAPSTARYPSMGIHRYAPRDAAPTACGRRRAATRLPRARMPALLARHAQRMNLAFALAGCTDYLLARPRAANESALTLVVKIA